MEQQGCQQDPEPWTGYCDLATCAVRYERPQQRESHPESPTRSFLLAKRNWVQANLVKICHAPGRS